MKKILFPLLIIFLPLSVFSQNLYFPPVSGSAWDTLSPQSLGWCQNRIDSLYDFLEAENTKSFILLKDGKIVLEQYFNGHTANDPWYWASAGKTLTAFMTGIAQQEGFLQITDTTSQYLGTGWTSCTPLQEEKITIRNQLTMTSGLDDAVPDLFCTLSSCLLYEADAGTRWAYHNGPYTLLDAVIENATGVTLNSYTAQKLGAPAGITGLFVPSGYNNIFVSTARSMARFGLLILNDGNWNGNQIMTDTAYFNQMVNTSQPLNESYGYLWWLNGKNTFMVPGIQFQFPGFLNTDAPADMIAALGKNGQFLNVVPSQNLVWLRMGDAPDSSNVPFLLNNEIWQYINQLGCSTTGINESAASAELNLFPNPALDLITITSDKPVATLSVMNSEGKPILKETGDGKKTTGLNISRLPKGFYLVRITFADGTSVYRRFLK